MRTLDDNWFPGRVIGGIALIAGPLLWAVGLTLRWLPFEIGVFTPAQIEYFEAQDFALTGELHAYQEVPGLVLAGYAAFLLGAAVLMPAFLTLARIVSERHRRLAVWGALLICAGLFARFYFTGVEQTAFQLSEDHGLEWTLDFVLANYADISYGPWRVPVWLSVGQFPGMALLTFAVYRAGVFGLGRCLLLLPGASLWMGVLKGSEPYDVVGAALACVVLVPLGVRVLRDRVGSREPRLLSW